MKINRGLSRGIALISILAVSACAAPKTTITSVWKDQDYPGGKIKKVLVIGAAEKADTRKLFEDEFVRHLKSRGIAATPSYQIIPQDKMLDTDTVLSKINGMGIDGVIVTRLLYKETVDANRPAEKDYRKTRTYYGDFNQYISTQVLPTPTDPKRLFHLETNLYETGTEKLVWSARTESFVIGASKQEIKKFIEVIMKNLSEQKLLD